jgi:hypothetical protein
LGRLRPTPRFDEDAATDATPYTYAITVVHPQ